LGNAWSSTGRCSRLRSLTARVGLLSSPQATACVSSHTSMPGCYRHGICVIRLVPPAAVERKCEPYRATLQTLRSLTREWMDWLGRARVQAAVRSLHTAAPTWMSSGGVVTADDIEHATGLELAELNKAVKGGDLFTDSDAVWLNSVR